MSKAIKQRYLLRRLKRKVHPIISCYDLHSSGDYKRKDMRCICVNYLDLNPKLNPQCELDRHHFWCQCLDPMKQRTKVLKWHDT
jgi:hypothetical protein